jgi:hypothetical protein
MEKTSGKLETADYDGSSSQKPYFYVRLFHVKNIRKLVVPMIFLITKKFLLYTILYHSYTVLSTKEYKSLLIDTSTKYYCLTASLILIPKSFPSTENHNVL